MISTLYIMPILQNFTRRRYCYLVPQRLRFVSGPFSTDNPPNDRRLLCDEITQVTQDHPYIASAASTSGSSFPVNWKIKRPTHDAAAAATAAASSSLGRRTSEMESQLNRFPIAGSCCLAGNGSRGGLLLRRNKPTLTFYSVDCVRRGTIYRSTELFLDGGIAGDVPITDRAP